ncbi:cation transporter [Paenibacillus sp. Marseille-Q4541]|uniref:cation transporter n=1 Tax=Paenibacillus sp. Marseille-Q4541 TaxID=2831522 RepID=UPI001BA7CD2C|nr:cation transporter [Paenibacillus sp. Marseille-Q4541]
MTITPQQAMKVPFWTEFIKNTVLTILKGSVGFASGNKALLSDALYSAGEAGSLFTHRFHKLGGTGLSEEYSKKMIRTGLFMALIIPLLVLLGGLQLAISAVRVMISAEPEPPHMSALIAAIIAFAIAEIWFQYEWRHTYKDAERSIMNHYFEQHRYAFYTSLLVLIGIIVAMVGKTFDYSFLLYADPVAALVTSGLVIWRSYLLVATQVTRQEEKDSPVDTYDYMETVQRVHGIVTVEHIRARARETGINIDITITVNPRMSVAEAQEVAERSKVLLMGRFEQVSGVQLKVVPYQSDYPYKSNCELAERETNTLLQ